MSSDSVVYHKLSKIHTYEKGAKKEPPDASNSHASGAYELYSWKERIHTTTRS